MKFTSDQGQDRFVHEMIVSAENNKFGTFLDIGCNGGSTTKSLEDIGWVGMLFDKDPLDHERKSEFHQCDAKSVIYPKNWTGFDYLSLDVNEDSLLALVNIPLKSIKFRIITIEHDAYNYPSKPNWLRTPMRNVLSLAGYDLICSNVCCKPGSEFEDWWVSPELSRRADKFRCEGKYWNDIFNL